MKIEQRHYGITLIEKRSTNTAEALQGTFPDRRLCLCDFYVAGSEAGLGADGVVTYRDLLIIDHHAVRGLRAL